MEEYSILGFKCDLCHSRTGTCGHCGRRAQPMGIWLMHAIETGDPKCGALRLLNDQGQYCICFNTESMTSDIMDQLEALHEYRDAMKEMEEQSEKRRELERLKLDQEQEMQEDNHMLSPMSDGSSHVSSEANSPVAYFNDDDGDVTIVFQ